MRSSVQALLIVAAVTVCGSSAWALPPDQIVTYKARRTPSDPNSSVLIEHRLHIAAQSQDGDDITWKFNKLAFSQPGGDNWTDASPGLSNWVVTHADPDNPVASDFTSPPNFSGTAANDGISGDDLDYAYTLGSCMVPEAQMFSGDVTCAAYSYVSGTTTIAEEDEDEPEEIESEDDPI